ncbi:MAG: hypothetical protein AB7T38_06240 [Nitrospirales bacterium]
MKIETINCENSNDTDLWADFKESLLSALKGTVFHLTSQHAFGLIQKSGAVEHNKNECFNLNTGSLKSFGRLMGWVCLFDLRHAKPELITDILDRYDFCHPPGNLGSTEGSENCSKRALAYLILDPRFYGQLIHYEKYIEHTRKTGQYPMAIPKVETWIANRIPIKWLEKVILTKIGTIMTQAQIQRARVLEQAHRNLPWNRDYR